MTGFPRDERPAGTDTPGGAAPAARHALIALVARLREAELTPTAEELADALWLAARMSADGDSGGDGPVAAVPGRVPGPAAASSGDSPEQPSPPLVPAPEPRLTAPPAHRARLFVPMGTGGEGAAAPGAPVPAPTAALLPDPLGLQRALRPLQHYRAPARSAPRVLDEQSTAERAADTGLVVPVLRHARRRSARLLLLMDLSTSTVVWEQALVELRQVCERAGAFREVQVRYLHEGPGGRPGHTPSARPGAPLQDPHGLTDPTGRRLTLVLSDCAGPMWRSGHMQRLLHAWGTLAPVAVVQPLPQRMWLRTHLPARRGVLHRREGPAGRLDFEPTGQRGGTRQGATPVPVLALRRSSVEGWARLVSAGATGQSLEAAAGFAEAWHPASRSPVRARQDLAGDARVRAFRRSASPLAWQLAVYLAAVPTTLPVMQLVQRAMLAGTGPEVLAEVLLGGLLERDRSAEEAENAETAAEAAGAEDSEAPVAYRFLDGVEDALLDHLPEDEARLLHKYCSAYLERRFGRTAHSFPALAVALDTEPGTTTAATGAPAPHPQVRAFAEVSGRVLRRYLPRDVEPETAGEEPRPAAAGAIREEALAAWERYRLHEEPAELDRAVALLATAVRAETDALRARAQEAVARAERGEGLAWAREMAQAGVTEQPLDALALTHEALARALLLRYRVRGDAADLAAARQTAMGIGHRDPGSAEWLRARVTLAETLAESAAQARRHGVGAPTVPEEARRRALELGPDDPLAALWAEFFLINEAVVVLGGILSVARPEVPADPAWRATQLLVTLLARYAVIGARIAAADGFRARPDVRRVRLSGDPEDDWVEAEAAPHTWYEQYMARALAATEPLTRPPWRAQGLLLRAQLRLRLARYACGQGDVEVPAGSLAGPNRGESGLDRRELGPELALGAAADFRRAVSPGTLDTFEQCSALLDRADALCLMRTAYGGADRHWLLAAEALSDALAVAGTEPVLLLECHRRAAHVHWQHYRATGSAEDRQQAIDHLEKSLSLLSQDDPRHTPLLEQLGARLAAQGLATRSHTDTDAAVRALRDVLDATSAQDPDRDRRRLALALAHIHRFDVQEVLADLHEADWILGAVARESHDSRLRARALRSRGSASALLGARTRTNRLLRKAVEYFRGGADAAREAEDSQELARALTSLSTVLEQLGETGRAFGAYREALRELRESDPAAFTGGQGALLASLSLPADDSSPTPTSDELRMALIRLQSLLGEA
ncbi:metallophosphoesterase [Streptomyces sp. NA04227]|uniref:SAV_2336 N-terminal domain-related protein n=1 Tax=Streptomyces sp. NA04227 TaxID=2742136 RepID=UPI0015925C48|nr:SAV_2336 N-terminal domain-related protein [Streptomyces sp. NA04227]QKW09121.1 metallophosphoesterase [Streptomyces sp. NA04227]